LLNTIVANSVAGGDCSGTITDIGNNLDTDGTCPFALTAPSLLGPLANNGGPTQTHALLFGSPAIDGGTNAGCPGIDQRSFPRPIDGDADTIAVCDIGAFELGIPMPSLTIVKNVLTIEDPFKGTIDPKAVPGATERYQIVVANVGPGEADNDSVLITEAIPANTALRVVDFDVATPGPVAFVDGSPVSGLTYTFTSLGSITDDIEFSNDGGTTWTYTPVATGNGTDPAVTDIRINPKGILAGSIGAGDPGFQLLFKVVVQ
ncbi:MAG: choice-of-anchor Q domain-containing protein, partial [Dehalococcoidia bacterium]